MQRIVKSILLIMIFVLAGCNKNQDQALIADSNWTQGELANGLRYHIYPTQDEQVSVRMMVHAGSLQENSDQKGYAHFIEHMAFNGTRNFSGNEIIQLMEQSGKSFGADINAFTGYQLTSYKLDLASAQELPMALSWMRDIGDGILFDPDEVEKEKGVIQGEFRYSRPEHKSLAQQVHLRLLKGTPLEHADPLGTETSVQQATADGLKSYYQRWYQPQNVELVVVGDIDPTALIAQIEQQFANWTATTQEKSPRQIQLHLDLGSQLITLRDNESPSLHYTIDRGTTERTMASQLRQQWMDNLAYQLIYQRVNQAIKDGALSVQYVENMPYRVEHKQFAIGGVAFAAENRQQVEATFIATLRALRDFGVSQDELDAAMTSFRMDLDNVDSNWSRREPALIADDKVYALKENIVLQGKEAYRTSLQMFTDLVDLEQVNQHLNQLFSSPIQWIVGLDQSEDVALASERLEALPTDYARPGNKPIELVANNEELLQPTTQGQLLSRSERESQMTVWQLSNGVEVWLQPDERAGERVYFNYASQGGKAALPAELYPASNLLINTVLRSGLGQLSGSQLDTSLRKKDSAIYPFIGLTVHGLEGNVAKAHLGFVFNAVYNIVTQVNLEPRQLEAVKQEAYQANDSYFSSPEGQFYQALNQSTYQPNSRHRFILNSELALVTTEQLQQVHKTLLGYNRNNKLVIIADMEPEQLAPLLRKYIASIELESVTAPLNFDIAYKSDIESELEVAKGNEDSVLVLKRLINTTPKARTAKEVFADDMLQRIALMRLEKQIREQQGLDYAPVVYPMSQDGEAISDWIIETRVERKDVDRINKELHKLVQGMGTSLTEQEVDVAAKQLTLALEPLDIDPPQRTWFFTRYLINGYGIEPLFNVEQTMQEIDLEYMQQRAQRSFGDNSKQITALLTPKS